MAHSDKRWSRRGVAGKLLTAGLAAAASGYLLFEYPPWLNYETESMHTRSDAAIDPVIALQMKKLIHYATLAANGHNTQPWKFLIRQESIEIHPDYSRRLTVVDPDNRELWISLGCSLENLLIAAREAGYWAEVTYPDSADFIVIRLTSDTRLAVPSFEAILRRQNTRSVYDTQQIPLTTLEQLQKCPLEPGISLHFVMDPSRQRTILDYVNQGDMLQYADREVMKELIHWLRFNKREALNSLDGLYSRCSGNVDVPRFLGEIVFLHTSPQEQAASDTRKLRSSPGVFIVASERESKTAWVRTGQVYQRVALLMTSLNLKSAFLNQPIEVARLRGQLQAALGMAASRPQLLVRFGYSNLMPQSLRRPVDQVLMTSPTRAI